MRFFSKRKIWSNDSETRSDQRERSLKPLLCTFREAKVRDSKRVEKVGGRVLLEKKENHDSNNYKNNTNNSHSGVTLFCWLNLQSPHFSLT